MNLFPTFVKCQLNSFFNSQSFRADLSDILKLKTQTVATHYRLATWNVSMRKWIAEFVWLNKNNTIFFYSMIMLIMPACTTHSHICE